MATTEQRFWAKVDFGDCWLWTAATVTGYGRFRAGDGRQVSAHRWAWEFLVGPILDGLTLDHLCRVRNCVNPDHLEPVTRGVNTLRGYSPPSQHARRSVCDKGHPLEQMKTQRLCPICRREYERQWAEKKARRNGVPVGKGAHNKAKTECVNGHPYTPENTGTQGNGGRYCRTCMRIYKRNRRALREQARSQTQSDI